MLKILSHSVAHTGHSPAPSQGQRSSLECSGNICRKCQMSHSCVLHISLTSWKAGSSEMAGDDFPHQTLPFRRGHSAPLTEFFTKKTHTQTHACIIPLYTLPPVLHVFVFPCVKLQLYRCPAGNAMLTDRHARGQPSTCVRHKDLSCLTTGCPAQHVALVTKPTLLAGAAFISPRNTEDGGRCFPR